MIQLQKKRVNNIFLFRNCFQYYRKCFCVGFTWQGFGKRAGGLLVWPHWCCPVLDTDTSTVAPPQKTDEPIRDS